MMSRPLVTVTRLWQEVAPCFEDGIPCPAAHYEGSFVDDFFPLALFGKRRRKQQLLQHLCAVQIKESCAKQQSIAYDLKQMLHAIEANPSRDRYVASIR